MKTFIDLKTSYYRPWMLIFRGGRRAGQRPRTTLAWCNEAIAENNHIKGYRVTVIRGDRLCSRAVTILSHEVAWLFKERSIVRPSVQAIQQAKERFPVWFP